MILKGVRRYQEHVDVDIPATEIINSAVELFDKFHGRPAKDCYIDIKGIWKVYDYTHPHNRDDIYKALRPATQEEQRLEAIRKEILQIREFQ